MTINRMRLLIPAFCAFAVATTAAAQGQTRGGLGQAPVVSVGADESSASRKVELSKGRSMIIDLPRDAKEVFVANPNVANAVVRSTRKVFVIGMEEGATSIFVMDGDGRQIAALDVVVARELKLPLLQQTLQQSFPTGRFEVRSAGDSIILSGTVASASDASRAVDLANGFVGATGATGGASGISGGTASRGAVINNLTIREKDQVMLRVTVVEVARTVLKQFGVNVSGSWSNLNFVNQTPLALSGSQFPNGNLLSGTLNTGGGGSLTATLRAFEQAGVSRILAEPTLTAISGESANFTAGGEIPVPSGVTCSGGNGCQVGLEFKPYGVSLVFTPVVLAENRISLRVGTEVREIDPQNSFNYTFANSNQTTPVPGMTVRKSETTIELASGATMMTAGLIQQKSKTAINGLPGLMNLPILGALFRSRDYQRQETELMIMVTPYIAKPMQPSQARRPDDGFVEATDLQGVLLGRVNKIYGSAGGRSLGQGYRGHVGFIAD
ncbi:type II and III secretion system protein family protein [Methylobacterium gnaphalii]|uniref:Secretin n=1 Tax=Methylobacterium gnaphalii TaxID=1010610 RepID=A0A512JLV8_9HYPH|nr:type II and III secretion system protein family protein [Methylobacterium gnaphalii]GEP10924.1 secretin [Methylobacterium gnaphalii]GJD69780.1 Type 3 secretion system secretin [Methylobacterium gnaphalii]GLS48092.1 secretin [Methylobacterium gnaphalii]